MEFKEGLMRLVVQKSKETNTIYDTGDRLNEILTTARSPGRRWKLFHRSSSAIPSKPPSKPQIPTEFICPISGSLMSDPVIVSSGHTFERVCVQLCKALDFTPHLVDSPPPDLTSVIPNLALKSTIFNWCRNYSVAPPTPPDPVSAEKLVRASCDHRKVSISDNESLIRGVEETPKVNFNHAATEVTRRKTHFHSSSDESVSAAALTPPLPFSTQPSCFSSRSSSSSEIETLTNPNEEEDGILAGLRSTHVSEIEAALTSLRRITRTREDARAHLCSPRLLSALKALVVSRYINIQVNSVAALVNLSLEKSNKIKIVRSGILPPLIDVLKAGSAEAQEHASGVIFSLALDDDCKTAIGVLGALPPLLNLINSESERTRHDSALGLYHLTLVQSNRSKLVKLGAVPVLLRMVKSGHMVGRVLLILGNLSWCGDGRAAMLDSGGVECLVGVLRGNEMDSRSSQESCVAALYGLSHGGLRFKGLAKAAGAVEVLREVEKSGSERGREKARRMLEMMRGREKEEEEEVDWEELLDSGLGSRTRFQAGGGGLSGSCVNSSEF